jgi:DNA primase
LHPSNCATQAKTATWDRIDWNAIRDRIDLARVVTALLGPAIKRQGRRLLWRCPFHDDRDPSFQVDPERGTWKCWPCDLGGDAPALVMKLKGITFPEAVRVVAELSGVVTAGKALSEFRSPLRKSDTPTLRQPPPRSATAIRPANPASPPPERSSGLPPTDALDRVTEAANRLWTPEGTEALAYLHGRGLTDETIRVARLGWTPEL